MSFGSDENLSAKLAITKVAVGCQRLEELAARQARRTENWRSAPAVPCITRYRPKRFEELVGGSLYWIIRHTLVARQTILGFEDDDSGERPRCRIMLSAALVPVAPRRKRAHQGWRYLETADLPRDLAGNTAELGDLPPALRRELTLLGLI